jgi:hypothetical protein
MLSVPKEVQDAPAAGMSFPSGPCTPADHGKFAVRIVENDVLDGEVIHLDGNIRLAPK